MSTQGTIQLAASSRGSLFLLKEDGSTSELIKNQSKISEYIEVDAPSLQHKRPEPNLYFSQMGPGLPSVCITAKYNEQNGQIESNKGESDLHIL